MSIFLFTFILLSCVIRRSETSCTFPDEIRGIWHSSHKGSLNFTDSTLYSYPIRMSALVSSLDFTCHERNGRLYMLKSTEAVLTFGQLVEAYICFDLNRVSATKYIYYIGTTKDASILDYVYGILNATVISISDACNRARPYETGTFITLIQDGSLFNGKSQATCPPDLLSSYSAVTISNAANSGSCSGSSFDGCSNELTFQMTYESCTSGLVFSASGTFYCLHYETSGGTTYIIVWNNDTTVTGSSTYRSTCYATRTSYGVLYATEYPGYCEQSSQTSTAVSSPGIRYTMTSRTATCVLSVTGGESGLYYFLIVLGIIIVVLVVFTIIVLIKKYKNKIRMGELSVYTKESKSRPSSSVNFQTENTEKKSTLPPIFPNKTETKPESVQNTQSETVVEPLKLPSIHQTPKIVISESAPLE